MKQRLGTGVLVHGERERPEDEVIVVVVTQNVGHDAVVAQVEDRTQIGLAVLSILEFGDVGQPFLVGFLGLEVTVQKVLRRDLRRAFDIVLPLPPDDRLEAHAPHQSPDPLDIEVAPEVLVDLRGEPSYAIDSFELGVVLEDLCREPVLQRGPLRLGLAEPLVVARP